MSLLSLVAIFPANITPHKPPLGRPPKRPSTDSNKAGIQTPPLTIETTPASKRPRFSHPVEKETPKAAKPQGVRRRAAASARQHRLKELSDSEGASEEDSMDSFDASWRSGSSDSLSLISLDAGQDVQFMDEDEAAELARQTSSSGQPSGRSRVYNRYCSGHKDDVIHCVCASFKEEGFMIQVTYTSLWVLQVICVGYCIELSCMSHLNSLMLYGDNLYHELNPLAPILPLPPSSPLSSLLPSPHFSL